MKLITAIVYELEKNRLKRERNYIFMMKILLEINSQGFQNQVFLQQTKKMTWMSNSITEISVKIFIILQSFQEKHSSENRYRLYSILLDKRDWSKSSRIIFNNHECYCNKSRNLLEFSWFKLSEDWLMNFEIFIKFEFN